MLNKAIFFDDNEMLDMMRDRFLKGLVTRDSRCSRWVKEALSHLELSPCFTFPTIALLEPAGVFPDAKAKRQRLAEMKEYWQRNGREAGGVMFADGEDRLGLLFSWVSREVIETVNRRLREAFSHPVNIGVGKPCSQLTDVHHSYRQAQCALQGKFYKGVGEVVYYSDLCPYHRLSEYPADKERELYRCVKGAEDEAEIGEAVERFYGDILQHGPVDLKCIYELTIRLLIGIERRASADLEFASAYNSPEIMTVLELQTLREIKDYVFGQLNGLRSAMRRHEREGHRSIIKKTIQYMEQECQQATLDSVARKVYMTPTYLSSLFKTSTGKTFIEQLTEIRIAKAKEMLKHTHLKNYEVAEKVGYKDSRYFSQIFKKKVGLSPSEYRDSAKARA